MASICMRRHEPSSEFFFCWLGESFWGSWSKQQRIGLAACRMAKLP
jgi:hypothetical protein